MNATISRETPIGGCLERLVRHIAQMAPHQKYRTAGRLLIEAAEEIRRLRTAIDETIFENAHLADGDNCTLIKIKRAMVPNAADEP